MIISMNLPSWHTDTFICTLGVRSESRMKRMIELGTHSIMYTYNSANVLKTTYVLLLSKIIFKTL